MIKLKEQEELIRQLKLRIANSNYPRQKEQLKKALKKEQQELNEAKRWLQQAKEVAV